MPFILVLSGAVASGKSVLSAGLVDRYGAIVVSTRDLIRARRAIANERGVLQAAGDTLDEETGGAWVAEGVGELLVASGAAGDAVLVVDAVRKSPQVDGLRKRWPDRVYHVHLRAGEAELERRYLARLSDRRESKTYAQVKADATEAGVEALADVADVVIATDGVDTPSLVARAVAGTVLAPTRIEPLVDVVVGAQYGSEGKGNVCAAIAGRYGVLMRVGGPNAGHKVRDPDVTFRQLPSGSAHNREARILIGAGATIDLEVLLAEIMDLDHRGYGVSPRLSIDPQAMIIERTDRDREAGGLASIASTKQGVGVATARKIVGRGDSVELDAKVRLARDVPVLGRFTRRVDRELEDAYARGLPIMLEGTQGTDLSLHHGSWPHVTSRDTTASGCLAEAGIAPRRVRRVVMVARTYPIRVGGPSGPFAAAVIDWGVVAGRSGIAREALEGAELGSVSRNLRRVGAFSFEQVRRAAVLNGATDIALTFADYLGSGNAAARSHPELEADTLQFIAEIERVTGVHVSYVVKGPKVSDVLERDGAP